MTMRDQAVMRDAGDGWLSLDYVARTLAVTRHRVTEMIDAGVLEAHRIGHCTRIRKSELERYLAHWKASQTRSHRP